MIKSMFWFDLETTGLESRSEIILEVGCMVTDQWGQLADHYSSMIKFDPKRYNWDLSCDPVVKQMHAKSGLFQSVINNKEGEPEITVWNELEHFLIQYGVNRHPMCGSSVQFDRQFMDWHAPQPLMERLHYRNIDTSSMIESMKLVNPDMFAQMELDCPGREQHRVIPDLEDTIERYKWMLKNYFRIKE